MAQVPKIPMTVAALPPQRLYAVPELPYAPPGWRVDLGNRVAGLPQRRPRSARYLGQVEWAWSPMHSRIDAYHLSMDRSHARWVLWASYFDDCRWGFFDTHIAASAPRAGLQGADAAVLLLQAYWRDEAASESELDAFHWVNQEGLLRAAHLKEVARQVWGDTSAGNAA